MTQMMNLKLHNLLQLHTILEWKLLYAMQVFFLACIYNSWRWTMMVSNLFSFYLNGW